MTGPYHVETSLLVCSSSQWTGFYMIRTTVMKVLIYHFDDLLIYYYAFIVHGSKNWATQGQLESLPATN